MLKLKDTEIYLTNVCNLGCNNCNRFNNFAFKGHHRWQDDAPALEKWSKVCEIDKITLIGGEPFTNPDLLFYVRGVRKLWPKAKIVIASNGTYMSKVKEMIEDLRISNINLRLSFHNKTLAAKTLADLDAILEAPVSTAYIFRDYHLVSWKKTYEKIKGYGWPDCPTPYDFSSLPQDIQDECHIDFDLSYDSWLDCVASRYIVDAKGLNIEINWYDNFHDSAIKFDRDSNKISLHDSDPIKAVEICDSKSCHTITDGKLHKCSVAAILPKFVNQFKIDVSNEDLEIINSYEPASPDWPQDKLSDFINELEKFSHIPQCKFCPQHYDSKPLNDVTIKPKIDKR